MGNYRPVSLTSVIGKILESIIKDEIVEYLEVHDKIGLSQYSFIKGTSLSDKYIRIFEEVTRKLDKGEPVDGIYLDFQKAFDKVLHRRLLNKLRALGVKGKFLAWIEGWLTGKRQRLVLRMAAGDLRCASGVSAGNSTFHKIH